MPHVFVGMSGGVDSSVAALLLKQQGYEVSGVNLRLMAGGEETESQHCGSSQDAGDARRIAERIGCPFYVFDRAELFRDIVIQNFIDEYEAGRTPNPCVLCNRTVKFGALLEQVRSMDGDYLATGHYARIIRDEETGRFLLQRGADRKKDQSYFLYMLTQEQLAHTLFPLGGLTKDKVRAIAEEHGLVNARKKDSQDICFVPDGDYAAFIEKTTGRTSPTGAFLDLEGNVLGQHKGFIRYTRGQHKGLGLPTAAPLYVQSKDPVTGAIRLGPDSALWSSELIAKNMNWIAVENPQTALRVTAKTRYSQKESGATVEPMAGGFAKVVFDEPQRAITAGQAVVLYDGESVVGGGTICE